jgi:hypothetical protein
MRHPSPYHAVAARRPATRRDFLRTSGGGFGALALLALLQEEGALGSERDATNAAPLNAKWSNGKPPRAKRVVQLFMAGAASHIDLWDPKPELAKRDGQPSDFGEPVEAFQNGLGPWKKPIWEFRPYGESGRMLAEPVAALGRVADEMAFVHDVVGKTGVHSAATLLQTTGFQTPGYPSAGSWVSYGLGSLNDDLPAFVVLPDERGLASNGAKNWDSAFLPGQHSGTAIKPGAQNPIENLFPHEAADFVTANSEAATRALLAKLDAGHAASREDDPRLEARIRSYELAARMQLSAPEALDLSQEPQHVLDRYGIAPAGTAWSEEINAREEADRFGRRCLVARRMLERGVRFVQIWSGNDNGFPRRNWDSHEDVERDHGPLATGMAIGAAALIEDLRSTGLLDDTIVLWTTEFGRMPSTQGGKGRDHNPFVFTNWLCGGGIKGGATHGQSDEWGYKPLDRANPTQVYDVHATILHLLGIDHEKLTVLRNGIDRRLTDVHGHVLDDLIA